MARSPSLALSQGAQVQPVCALGKKQTAQGRELPATAGAFEAPEGRHRKSSHPLSPSLLHLPRTLGTLQRWGGLRGLSLSPQEPAGGVERSDAAALLCHGHAWLCRRTRRDQEHQEGPGASEVCL